MASEEEDIKYFVRISNTDLDGTKSVRVALTGIAGVGRHAAEIIARRADVGARETMGRLDDDSIERLRGSVDTYAGVVPTWMLNRTKDVYTGEPRHILGTDLAITHDEDINLLRKIRCYRGIRHETGQKVRGQRTKSTGRTGATVGVRRKKD